MINSKGINIISLSDFCRTCPKSDIVIGSPALVGQALPPSISCVIPEFDCIVTKCYYGVGWYGKLQRLMLQ